MSAMFREWVEKAEGDYHSAMRELRARKYPNYDAACFHAQQCVEKYFKGLLVKNGVYFPPTHDLNLLLDLLLPVAPFFEPYRADLKMLSSYAVEVRYPGESTTKDEARELTNIMKRVRKEFQDLLRLDL